MSDNALFAFSIVVVALFIIILSAGLGWLEGNERSIFVDAVNKCIQAGNAPADCRAALD